MHGLGTIVNVAAIVVGGLAGLLGGRRIPERLQKTLMSAMGVSVLFVGVSGTLSQMLRAEGGALTVQGTMMMILSLAVGAVLGELLDLEDRMERFGAWLKVKTKSESDGGFIGAFVTASLTVCIGAMAIVGSIQDGILGDHATLFAKAVLDLVIIMVMTASMGKGCIFSAIPVGILQGSVTLLARLLPQRLVDALLPEETARRKVAELSRSARVAIVEAVQRRAVTPQATAGLKKAEACSGGVNTDEVDPKTMRSLLQNNLFVVGELLDVTGLLGGYNLHWAWASGMAAARELARSATVRAAAPATD